MSQNTKRYHETSKFNIQYLKTTVVKKKKKKREKKVFNIAYRRENICNFIQIGAIVMFNHFFTFFLH